MLLKDLIRQASAAKLLDTSPAAVADLIKRGRVSRSPDYVEFD